MKNILPCVHDCTRQGLYSSGSNSDDNNDDADAITVRLISEEVERMVYRYPDGKVIKTRFHPTPDFIVSPPFNPINCPDCETIFLKVYFAHYGHNNRHRALKVLERLRQVTHGAQSGGVFVTLYWRSHVHVFNDPPRLAAWLDRHRQDQGADPWAVISRLERVPMASLDQTSYHNDLCCVCLGELIVAFHQDGDEKKVDVEMEKVNMKMPCGHVFHGGCILDWLLNSHYCPLCRFRI